DETVVDVGGGNGAFLQALLDRRPGLRGIVFDLPSVAAEAEARIRAAGLAGRCAVVAGSFFDEVPPGGDVYVLSHILPGFEPDRQGVLLLLLLEPRHQLLVAGGRDARLGEHVLVDEDRGADPGGEVERVAGPRVELLASPGGLDRDRRVERLVDEAAEDDAARL